MESPSKCSGCGETWIRVGQGRLLKKANLPPLRILMENTGNAYKCNEYKMIISL